MSSVAAVWMKTDGYHAAKVNVVGNDECLALWVEDNDNICFPLMEYRLQHHAMNHGSMYDDDDLNNVMNERYNMNHEDAKNMSAGARTLKKNGSIVNSDYQRNDGDEMIMEKHLLMSKKNCG